MSKKELLESFIKTIQERNKLTDFIKLIFDYNNLQDYNYIFRLSMNNNEVIIDIYDNISDNRFNRYIFSYDKGKYETKVVSDNNVFKTYIDVLNLSNPSNKLYKLGYMTILDKEKIIDYGNTFLSKEYIDILKEIIK